MTEVNNKHIKSSLQHGNENLETQVGHCALNQLTYWLYKSQAQAITLYQMKITDWEQCIENYLNLCILILNEMQNRNNDTQMIENQFNRYTLEGDDHGMVAIFHLLSCLTCPLLLQQNNIIYKLQQDNYNKDRFSTQCKQLQKTFKESPMIINLLQACRIITLDTQISKRTTGYCMAWLADYSQISPRYLRQLFEKDTQHLKSIYARL